MKLVDLSKIALLKQIACQFVRCV